MTTTERSLDSSGEIQENAVADQAANNKVDINSRCQETLEHKMS